MPLPFAAAPSLFVRAELNGSTFAGHHRDTVSGVELELGRHTFDVSTRALVLATVDADCSRVGLGEIVAQRPAVIEVFDASQLASAFEIFAGPIVIRTSSAEVAERCLAAGAAAAHDPSGLSDPAYLSVLEEADASVIIGCEFVAADGIDPIGYLIERARWAEAAGIQRSRIVLHIAAGTSNAFADSGYALMTTTDAVPEAQGVNVVAAMHGVRLIANDDVRATRRTVDTVAELLARRQTAMPELATARRGP